MVSRFYNVPLLAFFGLVIDSLVQQICLHFPSQKGWTQACKLAPDVCIAGSKPNSKHGPRSSNYVRDYILADCDQISAADQQTEISVSSALSPTTTSYFSAESCGCHYFCISVELLLLNY